MQKSRALGSSVGASADIASDAPAIVPIDPTLIAEDLHMIKPAQDDIMMEIMMTPATDTIEDLAAAVNVVASDAPTIVPIDPALIAEDLHIIKPAQDDIMMEITMTPATDTIEDLAAAVDVASISKAGPTPLSSTSSSATTLPRAALDPIGNDLHQLNPLPLPLWSLAPH